MSFKNLSDSQTASSKDKSAEKTTSAAAGGKPAAEFADKQREALPTRKS